MRTILATVMVLAVAFPAAAELRLGDKGYFETPGLNVIVFDDIYPEGHRQE